MFLLNQGEFYRWEDPEELLCRGQQAAVGGRLQDKHLPPSPLFSLATDLWDFKRGVFPL